MNLRLVVNGTGLDFPIGTSGLPIRSVCRFQSWCESWFGCCPLKPLTHMTHFERMKLSLFQKDKNAGQDGELKHLRISL